MAISNKTRKTLWGKSGNRCAICKIELVHDEEFGKTLNVGEECHVISERPTGPRYKVMDHYDDYKNLILLCRNHHIEIDTHESKYNETELYKIKLDHETWVNKTLEQKSNSVGDGTPLLKMMTNGKELADIIVSAKASSTYHDDVKNETEAGLVGGFVDLIREYVDFADDVSAVEIANMALYLKTKIDELTQIDYLVFAASTKENVGYGLIFNTANVHVIHKNNPTIQKVNITNTRNEF
ncbi:MAG TPA: HNH endonuclease [Cyclobacteriaceae bacterium]|jgi:hypothetical protein|nr:HNH endonuclease [Cyclobacteriaceae bacterium]